jgi:hypothetical protein
MGVRRDRRTRSDAFGPESGRRTVRLANASGVEYGSRETRAMHVEGRTEGGSERGAEEPTSRGRHTTTHPDDSTPRADSGSGERFDGSTYPLPTKGPEGPDGTVLWPSSYRSGATIDLTLGSGPEMPYARRRSYGRPRSEGRARGRVGSDDHASWYRGSKARATARDGCRRERPRDALRSWRREPEPSDRPGSESRPNTMEVWSEVARNVELSSPASTTDRTNSKAATGPLLERSGTGSTDRPSGPMPAGGGRGRHSTVTLFARLRGLSIGRSRSRAV